MSDSIIIGDSQTKYFWRHLQQSSDLKVVVDSVSGRKVQDVDNEVMAKLESFDKVIVHLGTNNIPLEGPATTVRRMEKLLTAIRSWNPGCTLYVSSILPRAVSNFPGPKKTSKQIEELNEKATTLNNMYRVLSTQFERCFFFNNNVCFMDGEMVNRHLLSKDGLHLTPDGVEVLLGNMLSSLVSVQCCKSSCSSPPLPSPPPLSAFSPLPYSLPPEVFPVNSTSSSRFFSYRDALLLPPPLQPVSVQPASFSSSQSFSPSLVKKFSSSATSPQRFSPSPGRKSAYSQPSKASSTFSQRPGSFSKRSFSLLKHSRSVGSSPSFSPSQGRKSAYSQSSKPSPTLSQRLRSFSKRSFSLLKHSRSVGSSPSFSPSQGRKSAYSQSSKPSPTLSQRLRSFSKRSLSRLKHSQSSGSSPSFSPSQGRKSAYSQPSKPSSTLSQRLRSFSKRSLSRLKHSQSSGSSPSFSPSQGRKSAYSQPSKPSSTLSQRLRSFSKRSLSRLKHSQSSGSSPSFRPSEDKDLRRVTSFNPKPPPSHRFQGTCTGKKLLKNSTFYSLGDYQVPLTNRSHLFLPHHFDKHASFPLYYPINGGGQVAELGNRYLCDQCNKTYASSQSLTNHKKKCVGSSVVKKINKVLINYPRMCEICKKIYQNRQSFSNHKNACRAPEVVSQGVLTFKCRAYQKTCALCKREFKSRQGFWKHKKTCGKKKKKYPRTCCACRKTYKSRSSFYSHQRLCPMLQIIASEEIVYPSSCIFCSQSFNCQASYSGHLKTCSVLGSAIPCKFEGCIMTFRSKKIMLRHLKSYHLSQATQILNFKSFIEFEEWKKKETHICYQKKVTSSKFLKSRSVFHYYQCMFNVPKRSQKRNVRKTVRKKRYGQIPEDFCPSSISVKEFDDGSVSVKYISCHSHENRKKNLLFMRWQPETRVVVKSLLELGVKATVIMKLFNVDNPSSKNEREQFKTNLINLGVPPDKIEKQFNFGGDTAELPPLKEHYMSTREILRYSYCLKIKRRKAKDDATAIMKRVNEMPLKDKQNILVYKPQGCMTYLGSVKFDSIADNEKLFVYGFQTTLQLEEMRRGAKIVLCVDITHNTNRYGFNLLNLLVPDEFGCGFLVGHFIINREDTESLILLFRIIKNRCPDLDVNAVMTDLAEATWNAFHSVFSQDNPNFNTKHLLCSWHVIKAWRENLTKIGDLDLRTVVFQELRALLFEKNTNDFKIMLSAFITKHSQSDAACFLGYFRKYYEPKVEQWAFCYRNFPHYGIDDNNILESAHRVIKFRLGRQSNLTAYDLILALEDLSHERSVKLFLRRLYGEPPKDFQNKDDLRHIKGMRISHASIKQISTHKWLAIPEEKNGIVILDENGNAKFKYTVVKEYDECNLPDHCYDKCGNLSCFSLCSHLYCCSCPDKANICKHVHRVHSLTLRDTPCFLDFKNIQNLEYHDEIIPEVLEPPCTDDVRLPSKLICREILDFPCTEGEHVHRIHPLLLDVVAINLQYNDDNSREVFEFSNVTSLSEFHDESSHKVNELPCIEDVQLSSDKIEMEKQESYEVPSNFKSPPINETANLTYFPAKETSNFELLVNKLRNLTSGGDPGVTGHILSTLSSEVQYCEAVERPVIVPPMACSFSPNQKSPLQRTYRTATRRRKPQVSSLDNKTKLSVAKNQLIESINEQSPSSEEIISDTLNSSKKSSLPLMFRTLAKRKKTRVSSYKNQAKLGVVKQQLIELITEQSPSSEERILDLETPSFDTSNLLDHSPRSGLSLCQSIQQPTKKLGTMQRLQSVPSRPSKLSRKKSKSFTKQIVSKDSALSQLTFNEFYVSEFELKSLDCHISDAEVKTLQTISSCFVRGWLYDSVIDIFIGILLSEDTAAKSGLSTPGLPKKQGLPCLALTGAVVQTVNKTVSEEQSFSRLPELHYRSCETLFIPSNLNDHWILLVIHVQRKKIHIYDPMRKHIEPGHEEWLIKWKNIITRVLGEDVSKWEKESSPDHILQEDKVNCGAFVCFYVFKLLNKEDPTSFFNPDTFRNYIYDKIIRAAKPYIRGSRS